MHPTHRTTSNPVLARIAVLALAILLGLGAAAPAVAAEPPAEGERPTWAAPWTHLSEWLGRLFGRNASSNRLTANSDTDHGPDMDDPNGLGSSGDGGPGMDPDGLGAEGDDGPDMDPNG